MLGLGLAGRPFVVESVVNIVGRLPNYKGRLKGTKEPTAKWAQKPKVKQVKSLLEKGVTVREIREIMGVSFNFISKVKDRLITNTRTEADILYDLYVDKDFRVVDGKAIRKRRP